jgi:hypothetical protein
MPLPNVEATTIYSKEIWRKGEGSNARVIYEVTLGFNRDGEDRQIIAKTYSQAIANVGFKGEVQFYEKDNNGKIDYFAKQVPKEGGWSGGGGGGGNRGGGNKGRGNEDNYTMYLSYAKDIAVALLSNTSVGLDEENYKEVLGFVDRGGKYLYNNRPGVDNKPAETPSQEGPKSLDDVFPEAVKEDIEEDPFDKLNAK